MTLDAILAALALAATLHGVPLPVLRAACTLESGLNPRAALCGVHRPHRSETYPNAEQPSRAAHALARWHARCGTWERAAQFFHTGDCALVPCVGHRHGTEPYGVSVARLARRIGGGT